ncbi:xanthine dehydrogenase family protein molybdopterin-binding subunit [Candidatus Poriferisodalis sp.]|uniref:xanthine dehydrogenase family protein molybdopterin-binding subunit n=1 Tax=Candidatus Poriferisodalis sp. TaxID=3101277 RepID=UPI003B5AA382
MSSDRQGAVGHGAVGQSVLRREDDYLLRGQGRFVDDLPAPINTLHLAFVLSPYAHARILSIDVSEARALDGVVDVLTGEDLAALVKPIAAQIELPGYHLNSRDVLAVDEVRFAGEAVAVVVAESQYLAEDGIELVQVDYEPLPVVTKIEEATDPAAPQVNPTVPGNVYYEGRFTTDGVAAGFEAAAHVISENFHSNRVTAVPIEPRGCLAVPEQAGNLVFYSSTQIHHLLRTALAEFLDVSESTLRVVVPDVGGGFGIKAALYPEEFVCAALALRLRRPVKWIQDRYGALLTDVHARDNRYRVEAAVDDDGIVLALKAEIRTNGGAYSALPFGCTLETTGGARMIVGPYRITEYSYTATAVATHTAPVLAYRGVAQPVCFMAIEGIMDRIARRLELDPAEVRLRNMVPTSELPWTNVVGVRYDTGSFVESLKMAMEMAKYDEFRARQAAQGRLVDGKYRGIGICSFTEVSGTGAPGWRARGLTRLPGFDSGTVKVEPTGKVTAFVSHAHSGQGHFTTFAQVVADELGARLEDVTVIEGDTAAGPYGTNTFASRSAVTGGGALVRASEKARLKLARIAADMLESTPEDIVVSDGQMHVAGVPSRSLSFQEVAETAYAMNTFDLPEGESFGIEETDFYDPPLVTMANATHIAQVAVDAGDGTVDIEGYTVVHDCGRVINPMIVEGQVMGGVAQGIGEALMEEFVYDPDGQVRTATLVDYLLPSSVDVPSFQIAHIESPSIDAVGGFKGVGEGGVIGAVPALVNAVADALFDLDVNVNTKPLRPALLSGLIREAGG